MEEAWYRLLLMWGLWNLGYWAGRGLNWILDMIAFRKGFRDWEDFKRWVEERK